MSNATENKAPDNTAPDANGTGAIQPALKKMTASERFMNKVIAEFGGSVGDIALSEFQKRLAQNYFIVLDAALAAAEEKRMKKDEKYRDMVPVIWENVNLSLLARSVVAKARIGLDPAQKNHVNLVPFKNNATEKYDIVFVDGYRGIELTAKKYGLDTPDAVIVDLVYSSDRFREVKKSLSNPVATYEFEVVNSFDRGEIIGGFYYHVYKNNPEKNKLVVMSKKDIEKRKPAYASVEFWGGERDIWEYDEKQKKRVKTGKTEHVEGWYEKMCYKTVYRAAYGDITIDSQKIDADYLHVKELESKYAEAIVAGEIEDYANSEVIDIDYTNIQTDPGTGEIIEPTEGDKPPNDAPKAVPAPAADPDDQTTLGGTEAPKPAAGKGSKPKAGGDPY